MLEILTIGLKSGNKEIIESILYKADLVKIILSINEPDKWDFWNHSSVSFLIQLANLIKTSEDPEILAMKESIPEWKQFEEGYLKAKNDELVAPLGGKDPKLKIESLFDENDNFKF